MQLAVFRDMFVKELDIFLIGFASDDMYKQLNAYLNELKYN
jgi:hypothetical protein